MALYYEDLGNDKYKLVYTSGSRNNRIKRSKNIQVTGSKKQIERALQRELLDFEEEIEEEIEYGARFGYDNKTLSELSEKWLEMKKNSATEKTLDGYSSLFRLRIIPRFGKIKVSDISPLMIQNFYTDLSKEEIKRGDNITHLSPNTIKRYHSVLSAMFNDAYRIEMIRENPILKVKPPKSVIAPAEFYSKANVDEMLPLLFQEPLQFIAIIMLTISSGIRRGELAAIKWSDIDFDNNTVIIQRAVTLVKTKRIIKTPKTESRLIQLPEMVTSMLNDLLISERKKKMAIGDKWKGEKKVEDNYIFTNEYGYWYHPDTYGDLWTEFLVKNNLKRITFHELRHTSASILIFAGLNIKSVQKIMGHKQSSTTVDIYGHIFQSANNEAANAMQEVFKGVKKGAQ